MVINRQLNPAKKIISATFSYFADFAEMFRIDRKDKILLHIKRMVATEVHSSINVVPFNFKTFKEVNTRKQIPNKLADVFKMCGALLFLSDISFNCSLKLIFRSYSKVNNPLIILILIMQNNTEPLNAWAHYKGFYLIQSIG